MKVSAPFEPGLVVRDLERALAFYRDVLGMTVVAINDVPPEITQRAGLTMNGYRVVRLDTDGGDRLKIMGPKDTPAANPSPDLILSRTGFVFLTYIVPDLKAVHAKLTAAGVKVRTGKTPVEFKPGVSLLFAEDPEGNLVEFVERNDLETYRPKTG
jgi:catechol 2,3-dioxygenase-like lactoylglutathione lyase family enzyme